jgi:mercuric ion transport protein
MPDVTKQGYLVAGGGIAAALASAVCCAGPLVAVALGVSGAGIAARFEPLRPYFLAATAVLFASGFWLLRREERRACEPGTLCASSVARSRMRLILWLATALAVVFATFPTWSLWFLG